MDEPWLDSLSEDWDSRPPSSSPSSLPSNRSPATSAHHSNTSSELRHDGVASIASFGPVAAKQKDNLSISKASGVLTERSNSDLNIPTNSSSYTFNAKQSSNQRPMRPMSVQSIGSVVQHNSSVRKSRSSSPPKNRPHTQTPEWKRLVMNGKNGALGQHDLFSPIGLEGMFLVPPTEGSTRMALPRSTFSLLQSFEGMPSSPPPWPQNHRGSYLTIRSTKSHNLGSGLNVVQEQPENHDDAMRRSACSVEDVSVEDESPRSNQTSFLIDDHERSERGLRPANHDTTVQRSRDGFNVNQSNRSENVGGILDSAASSTATAIRSAAISPPPRQSDFTADYQGSSLSGAFSPVYISKRNTVDGQVDYTALDMSNPQILEELKILQSSYVDRSNQTVHRTNPSITPTADSDSETKIFAPEAISAHDQRYPLVSEVLGTKIVECFDADSSDTMAQSPSGSSSIVPSDSVSQVHVFSLPYTARTAVTADSDRDVVLETTASHVGHQTSKQIPTSNNRNEGRHKSSGSPLKLFADHDTFTNGRLLNRMTQLHSSERVQAQSEIHPYAERRLDTANPRKPQYPSAHDNVLPESAISSTTSVGTIVHQIDLKASKGMSQEETCSSDDGGHDRITAEALMQASGNIPGVDHEKRRHVTSTPERDVAQKRAASTPSKQPTPKRQRTVGQSELESILKYKTELATSQPCQLKALPVVQAERALGNASTVAHDVGIMSRKDIERPCNPTLTQSHWDYVSAVESIETSTTGRATLDIIHEHIEQAHVPCDDDNAGQIKALASEVATFRFKVLDNLGDNFRKPSVSTQDYVDEAMKIMDIIRSKRLPQSYLGDLQEPSSEDLPGTTVDDNQSSPETISRPPSRDGFARGWRSRDDRALDSRVVSQLRKYQETEDESFIVSAAFPPATVSENMSAETIEDDRTPEDYTDDGEQKSELVNLRITDPCTHVREGSAHNSDHSIRPEIGDSPAKTYSSNPSTDSTGRTVQTRISQRTRTVPVIAPGKVSHLISNIESGTGMRFDREKKTWVKDRTLSSRVRTVDLLSSSTGTEDDPFGAISDLSIDESEGQAYRQNSSTEAVQTSSRQARVAIGNISQNDTIRDMDASERCQEMEAPLTNDCKPIPSLTTLAPETELAICAKPRAGAERITEDEAPTTEVYPENKQNQPIKTMEALDEDTEYNGHIIDTPEHVSRLPDSAIQSKRRENSVLFSSPPVSREWEARSWNENSELSDVPEDNAYDEDADLVDRESSFEVPWMYSQAAPGPVSKRPISTTHNMSSRALSLTRIDEHHEISFIETRPDGRAMSLTLSVSTPLPAQRTTALAHCPNADFRSSRILQSLSPLSEFTMHRDDACHMEARHLTRHDQQISLADQGVKSAIVVNKLVAKLTDVEPDEPYWDSMRTLVLRSKDLQNIHMLNEFCPSVEELNISDNQLQQLGGVPSAVRHLSVRNNCLSSLTTWGHLIHLQYLDVSGNDIDSLEGLGGLVHMRELKADNNAITSIEGIFDLDGLLSLSLKQNGLSQLDFQSADLRRLERLDVSGNVIHTVQGLYCLPNLLELNLSHNELVELPTLPPHSSPLQGLQKLNIAHNNLQSLDLCTFPRLQLLDADNNCLIQIKGIAGLENLHTLCLRNQSPREDVGDVGPFFDDYRDVRNLYLSGNALTSLPITSHFLNLHTLELAFTGLHTLPAKFGILTPNLRVLNLNSNALKDLKPLRGIVKLTRLLVAGNRLSRLRKMMRIVERFVGLEELDLRDNPFSVGFYLTIQSTTSIGMGQIQGALLGGDLKMDEASIKDTLQQHVLPASDPVKDRTYVDRLDEDTKLKRRVYELLLAAKCEKLEAVDGLKWERESVFKMDEVWERLMRLGVVERLEGRKEDCCQVGDTRVVQQEEGNEQRPTR